MRHTPETCHKIRKWAKENLRGAAANGVTQSQYEAQPKLCIICNHPIPWMGRYPKKKQTCSTICASKKRSESGLIANKGSGGLRQGSGRGKKGRYKGIWCDSTFELAFVIYTIDKGLTIERFTEPVQYIDPIDNRTKNYYPDFRVNSQVIEIKGYMNIREQAKLDAAPFSIRLIMGPDLKEAFDHIEARYGVKKADIASLYE